MSDYIATDDLSGDIVRSLPPLKKNKAMEDAAKGLIDTILEQTESEIANAIEKAIEKIAATSDPPTLAEILVLTDADGLELGSTLSEVPHLDRVNFLRGMLDGMTAIALEDLNAEIVRR